ncbi:MAG TPA: CFI-box-CTERM domain-containing protein, partial [Syntrophales bacterium]|nr:CFI-box-CTERM domain-containing protein [Syntrophales bacterium]
SSGVYTNVVDAGNRTDYTVTGLDAGATYYFAAKAYTATGSESALSNEASYTIPGSSPAPTPTPPSDSSSGGGSGGGCFIATAAFGSGLSPEVTVLRDFRDRHLMTNYPGQVFVNWYYAVSPPVAAYIAEHESLRTVVRAGLTPVVYGVKYPAAALVLILVIPASIVVRKRLKDKG